MPRRWSMTNRRNAAGSLTASGSGLSFALFAGVVVPRLLRPRPPRRLRRFGASGCSAARGGLRDRLLDLGVGLGLLLGLLHRLAAHDPTHRSAQGEDPADAGHRLRADQAPRLEEPLVLGVELLERVVREDRAAGAVRDLQQEAVTAPDRARGRRDDLTRRLGLRECGALGGVDAVLEARVHHDGRDRTGVLGAESGDRLLELGEARFGPPLGGEIRSVDHEVVGHDQSPVTVRRSAAISRSSL